MDISRAVQFFTDDERWITKVAIGTVLGILGFLILPLFIVIGYAIQIARNVKDGMDTPLPEWDNWGQYLRDGFTIALAGFIYSLPIMILLVIGGVMAGVGSATDVDAFAALGDVALMIFGCIGFLYGLALMAIMPALYIQFIQHGTLGACLDFRTVIEITRNNLGDILLTVLVMAGISMVASFLWVIPCIGWIAGLAMIPLAQFIGAHLYGQIAAKVHGKGSKFDNIIID